MSTFPNKPFEGQVYSFPHLEQMTLSVDLTVKKEPISIPVNITFGCHCFTEEFNPEVHGEHHSYKHLGEERAFDVTRYECSLQLPQVMRAMLGGTIYRADKSYTYVAQISLPPALGQQAYSVFFSLEKTRRYAKPSVELFVKSGYLSQLKHSPNAQTWRFKALVGETAEVFEPTIKPRPGSHRR